MLLCYFYYNQLHISCIVWMITQLTLNNILSIMHSSQIP